MLFSFSWNTQQPWLLTISSLVQSEHDSWLAFPFLSVPIFFVNIGRRDQLALKFQPSLWGTRKESRQGLPLDLLQPSATVMMMMSMLQEKKMNKVMSHSHLICNEYHQSSMFVKRLQAKICFSSPMSFETCNCQREFRYSLYQMCPVWKWLPLYVRVLLGP